MKFSVEPRDMPLRRPFRIARGVRSYASSALSTLEHDGLRGLGETSPSARYGESVASVCERFARRPPSGEDPFAIDELLADAPPAARCLLDLSLHDWIGKRLDAPLWRYLGLDPTRAPRTSYTLGIDEPDRMLAELEAMRGYGAVKVKLGGEHDVEVVEAIRSRFSGALRLDANEAWTPEEAVATLRALRRCDIELCEQPIPAGSPERLRWIRERVPVPIVADEDARDARDVAALRGCVDGVNVKLVKAGGVRGALGTIRAARSAGLRVMLGCMLESSLLATAAAHLASLADWVDLDGPLLLADDPFEGVRYDAGGAMTLPEGPGLGVSPKLREALAS